jgi:hypothetical protein
MSWRTRTSTPCGQNCWSSGALGVTSGSARTNRASIRRWALPRGRDDRPAAERHPVDFVLIDVDADVERIGLAQHHQRILIARARDRIGILSGGGC